jgi:hypothetical protein
MTSRRSRKTDNASLLSEARKLPTFKGRPPDTEDDELISMALAWATGEIALSQVSRALNDGGKTTNTSDAYRALARGLRAHVKRSKR